MTMKKISIFLPGIALCFAISVPAWFLGRMFPVVGAPVLALVITILLSSFFPRLVRENRIHAGVKITSKKILQCAIVFLGFGMNLHNVAEVGGRSLSIILLVLVTALLVAFVVGKALKLSGNTTTLIGVGTSICGGSAIAAAAPAIDAKEDEVARAISTIFLFNVIAVFLFPVAGRYLDLSDAGFGIWAGTAVNDTSSVVAVGASWSAWVGDNTALEVATIVKLTRTLMIIPVTLFLAVFSTRNRKQGKGKFRFVKVFPWFVVLFVVTALLNTFAGIPIGIIFTLNEIGRFLIVMAMTAVGLNTNAKAIVSSGVKPIFLGLCCWIVVTIVALIGVRM